MKIAIAGYGLEGEENYNYWNTLDNELTVVDEREQPTHGLPENVGATILGPGSFEKLNGFDLVIRTAGLAPRKIKTDGKIWSATNEFFAKCPAQIIGVTGSKGKGTTSSLIASILQAAGKKVWLVGNIGVSALSILDQVKPDDIVVYELSSFQLWDIEKSPHTAVILFIEPEHLDVHADLDEYINAKGNITYNQTADDRLIYKKDNQYVSQIIERSNADKIPYQDVQFAHVVDGGFYYGEQKICSITELKIPGVHNLDNACAAIDVAKQYDVSDEEIIKGLNSFTGLPHRLKFVAKIADVGYYDDSIATTPGSAIAALAAFDQPKILILGGSSKGADFNELARKVVESNVKAVILIGQESDHIQRDLESTGYHSFYNLGHTTMEAIIGKARELNTPGDVVILSPSCASFDMFKNYIDRGNQFIAAVKNLAVD